jgi:hypothetical protein
MGLMGASLLVTEAAYGLSRRTNRDSEQMWKTGYRVNAT